MNKNYQIKEVKQTKYKVTFKDKLKGLFKNVTAKSFFLKSAIIIFSSFIMAVLILLLQIALSRGLYSNIEDFFNLKTVIYVLNSTAILIIMFSTLYSYTKFSQKEKDSFKNLWILVLCVSFAFLMSILLSLLINVYMAPIALVAMLIATLLDKKNGIVVGVLTSQTFFFIYLLMVGQENVIHGVVALLTAMVTSIFLVITLDKAKTRFNYIVNSLLVGVAIMFIPMLINLIAYLGGNQLSKEIVMGGVWSFLSVVLSVALYTLTLPILERIFKISTTSRMAELTSLANPLLKKLSKEAPGTFNHSLVVGSLVELCADAIGEDTQLAKAAAYYHDIGKMENPDYYGENQKGYNPHDDVIPEVSVSMIINHTTAGYEILKEAKMPQVIVDVTREHHGTTPVNYFLYKAQGYTEDHVDSTEFRYPGPKPSTKVAAIIMIVDTVEAASRAMAGSFHNTSEFRKFTHQLIKEKVDQDQFSECDLTFNDLRIIEDVLVEAIPSMFHVRIKYVKPGDGEDKESKIVEKRQDYIQNEEKSDDEIEEE
ncbi:MAG TPA: HDIG domain-containing protein [Clostridiales bacterium]|nr:HDIG domain-containing protein [Clostridiales bacterium]